LRPLLAERCVICEYAGPTPFPREVDPVAVRQYLESLPGGRQVHDLRIWAMSTSQIALTAHLVMPDGYQRTFSSRRPLKAFTTVLTAIKLASKSS
jgi:Co/Zn/Cd efflux system component